VTAVRSHDVRDYPASVLLPLKGEPTLRLATDLTHGQMLALAKDLRAMAKAVEAKAEAVAVAMLAEQVTEVEEVKW
jgi:hypothetical protein